MINLWLVTASFQATGRFGRPVLSLEGSARMLSFLQPNIDVASVYDCVDADDFQLVRETLMECLQGRSTSSPAESAA